MLVRSAVRFLLALGVCIGVLDARAGVQIEFQVRSVEKDSAQPGAKSLELYVKDGVVWIGNTLLENYIIYDSGEKTVTIVDHGKKQYLLVTESEIADEIEREGRIAAMMAAIDPSQFMEKDFRPEDVEKEFESKSAQEIDQILLQQGMTLKMQLTGESRKYSDGFADMPCQVYAVDVDAGDSRQQENVKKNPQHKNELCVASANAFDLAPEDLQALQQFLQLALRYIGRVLFPTVLGVELPSMGVQPVDGIPIHLNDLSEGRPPLMQVMLIQSVEISHADLIPENYQRASSSKDKCGLGCAPASPDSESSTQAEQAPAESGTQAAKSKTTAKKKRVKVRQKKQKQKTASASVSTVKSRKKRKLVSSSKSAEPSSAQPVEVSGGGCDYCPTMVIVPAGEFMMGALSQDSQRDMAMVTIPQFELSAHEVTREQYAAFINDTGHDGGSDCINDAVLDLMTEELGKGNYDIDVSKVGGSWQRPGFEQQGNHPVVCVSFDDAVAYVEWLSDESGLQFRLPSESEWEYAARAGTDTAYFWGNEMDPANAIWADGCGGQCKSTAPVGSLPANAFGLHDMHGNVFEWVMDDWLEDLKDAPKDGSANVSGTGGKVIRGGSFESNAQILKSTSRWRIGGADARSNNMGFRVARSIAR